MKITYTSRRERRDRIRGVLANIALVAVSSLLVIPFAIYIAL